VACSALGARLSIERSGVVVELVIEDDARIIPVRTARP
jgi:hypothetical protein